MAAEIAERKAVELLPEAEKDVSEARAAFLRAQKALAEAKAQYESANSWLSQADSSYDEAVECRNTATTRRADAERLVLECTLARQKAEHEESLLREDKGDHRDSGSAKQEGASREREKRESEQRENRREMEQKEKQEEREREERIKERMREEQRKVEELEREVEKLAGEALRESASGEEGDEEASRLRVYKVAEARERLRCRKRNLVYFTRLGGNSIQWFEDVGTEFDAVKFDETQPLTFESIPWPLLSLPQKGVLEDIDWAAIDRFFAAMKDSIAEDKYKVLLEQAHRRFHPDRWLSRGLLNTVLDEGLRRRLEVAGGVVAQAITPLWRQSKR